MSQNPYSPPETAQVDANHTKSLSCAVMFWLSCVLCLGMLGIATNGILQYFVYSSQMGIPLPSSLLEESVWVGFGGIVMGYSAIKWRRQLIPSAALSGGIVRGLFFDGFLSGAFVGVKKAPNDKTPKRMTISLKTCGC